MKSISIEISESTYQRISSLATTETGSINRIVAAAVADYLYGDPGWLGAASYPLFENQQPTYVPISTFNLNLIDLGIGITAEHALAVIVDGHIYPIGTNGRVVGTTEDVTVPYAMMVNFEAETLRNNFESASIDALVEHCQSLRAGTNIFYAFRVDGTFRQITVRTALARRGKDQAGSSNPAYAWERFEDIRGTIIGFWSSRFTSTVCDPGYHFYFLSPDDGCGGAIVDCSGTELRMLGMPVRNLRMIRPDGPDHRVAEGPVKFVEDELTVRSKR
jgi:alpha-acetolactate decarboxylase